MKRFVEVFQSPGGGWGCRVLNERGEEIASGFGCISREEATEIANRAAATMHEGECGKIWKGSGLADGSRRRTLRRGAAFGLALAALLSGSADARDPRVRAAFRRAVPCPATGIANLARCPGWVVDHMIPLCAGGPDHPDNLIWQELAQSRRKDTWERALCRRMRKAGLRATLPQGD